MSRYWCARGFSGGRGRWRISRFWCVGRFECSVNIHYRKSVIGLLIGAQAMNRNAILSIVIGCSGESVRTDITIGISRHRLIDVQIGLGDIVTARRDNELEGAVGHQATTQHQ